MKYVVVSEVVKKKGKFINLSGFYVLLRGFHSECCPGFDNGI